MKKNVARLLIAASIITTCIAACHSQKEMTNASGTKSKVQINNGTPKKDAMMQGDTMKRDNR